MIRNEQQARFVEAYVETGSATKAMEMAGYSPDSSNASKMVRKFSSEIASAYQQTMASKAGLALAVLEAVMLDVTAAPRDRIRASAEWLDRAGNLSKSARTDLSLVEKPFHYVDDRGWLHMGIEGKGAFVLPPKQVVDDELD